MSKKKKKEEEVVEVKQLEIVSASIKDAFCNYVFNKKTGIGAGDTISVKGKGLIKDDMMDAFSKFNAHLAAIDDIFSHGEIDIENIDKMHNHPLTGLYNVTGFKIKGEGDNESIILIGTKHINAGGQIELETPKIPLDQLSSYKWYNELQLAADIARMEVELYKDGKYDIAESMDAEDPHQMKITDVPEVDFEDAKV